MVSCLFQHRMQYFSYSLKFELAIKVKESQQARRVRGIVQGVVSLRCRLLYFMISNWDLVGSLDFLCLFLFFSSRPQLPKACSTTPDLEGVFTILGYAPVELILKF